MVCGVCCVWWCRGVKRCRAVGVTVDHGVVLSWCGVVWWLCGVVWSGVLWCGDGVATWLWSRLTMLVEVVGCVVGALLLLTCAASCAAHALRMRCALCCCALCAVRCAPCAVFNADLSVVGTGQLCHTKERRHEVDSSDWSDKGAPLLVGAVLGPELSSSDSGQALKHRVVVISHL